jgi:diacylglycerol kinase (ATP)
VSLAIGEAGFMNTLLTVIANGARFGGAFCIAPGADMSDGALDIVSIADTSPVRRVRLFAAAVRGTHLGFPEAECTRTAGTLFRFREPPSFQVDGDLYRASGPEVVVRCVPSALRVVSAGRGFPDVSSGSAR